MHNESEGSLKEVLALADGLRHLSWGTGKKHEPYSGYSVSWPRFESEPAERYRCHFNLTTGGAALIETA
jgi:hypothetical protein